MYWEICRTVFPHFFNRTTKIFYPEPANTLGPCWSVCKHCHSLGLYARLTMLKFKARKPVQKNYKYMYNRFFHC